MSTSVGSRQARPLRHTRRQATDRRVLRWRELSVEFRVRPVLVLLTLTLLALFLAAAAMTVGTFDLSLADVFAILTGQGDGGVSQRVVLNIRLPRVLTGLFAGAALGASGAVFQSVSRNALGSPDVIGFTTGAATGAIAQIVLFGGGSTQIAIAAVVGGVLTAAVVYLLSYKNGAVGGYRLVLTGIGVGAVLAAINGLLLVRGSLDNAVAANLWQAGSLNARNWTHVWPVLVGVALLVPLITLATKRLSIIEMGDDLAKQLGVPVERTRLLAVFGAVLLAALATAAAGPIAFVALAAPQLVMRLNGRGELPVLGAAAMGALLIVLADLLSQLAPGGANLPIGRMTGVVGGVYLIWLLTRWRQA